MAELIKSKFSDWTRSKLQEVFSLRRTYKNEDLRHWLITAETITLTPFANETLTYIQHHAQLGIDEWSEEEIKQEVIYPILALTHFTIVDQKTHSVIAKAFSGRTFGGKVGKYEMNGEPDGLIAKGSLIPKIPYFCLYEYKKQETNSDGLGQLLAAMLIAQELNTKKRPIYGGYIIGANWYFVILKGQEYSISKAYSVADSAIFDIYRILQQLKLYVIQFLKEDKDLS